MFNRFGNMCLADDQGRAESERIRTCCCEEKPPRARLCDDLESIKSGFAADPPEEPPASHFKERWMGRYELCERGPKLLSPLKDLGEEALFLDDVDDRQACTTSEWIPTKSARMCPGSKALSDLIGTEHRPDWNPTSETFGEGHNIWLYAVYLVREPGPSSTDSGLNLVKDK